MTPNTIGAGPIVSSSLNPMSKSLYNEIRCSHWAEMAFKSIIFQIIGEDQQRIRKMKTNQLHYTGLSPHNTV